MSILNEILEVEKKASAHKKSALEEKRVLIEKARKEASEKTLEIRKEALARALEIKQEKETELAKLELEFRQEIDKVKADLLKDISKKQEKAFKYLLEVSL
ncbi:MAG: hypothetical protein ACOX02_02795 [Acholeplasmatales bacterium]